jgi:hypothetical protein
MVSGKSNRKTKGAKPQKKGRRGVIFFAVVVFFVVLSVWFVFLLIGPDKVVVPLKIGEVERFVPAITYEEPDSFSEPVIIKSRSKKLHVAPGGNAPVVVNDRPVIAIVIDDMGYNKKICEALLDLDLNLSFAFLPFGSGTAQQAYKANRLGRDVLLHFPMEANDAKKWKAGRGTITLAMNSSEVRKVFEKNFASVPYAVGINNHMGSRYTQDNLAMQGFMKHVQAAGLFFLDSRTTKDSVGYSVAKKMAVKTAQRDIFLDNDRDSQKIKSQLRKLLEVARQHGSAIAIGHPYPETLQALGEYKREIRRQAVVVGVSALVR